MAWHRHQKLHVSWQVVVQCHVKMWHQAIHHCLIMMLHVSLSHRLYSCATCTTRTEAQHYCPSQAIRQTHRKEGQQQSQMMFAAHGCRKATRSCTNYVIGISSSHVEQGLHQYGIYFSGLSNFRTQQPCRMCMQCCTVICNGIELHSVY